MIQIKSKITLAFKEMLFKDLMEQINIDILSYYHSTRGNRPSLSLIRFRINNELKKYEKCK